MVMPTTRCPCSTSSAAAVALSTPPERAATTRGPSARMSGYLPASAMKSNRVEVTAFELDEAGLGVGAVAGGMRVHVADLLPGERAEVTIDHKSPHKAEAWGRVTRRLSEPAL